MIDAKYEAREDCPHEVVDDLIDNLTVHDGTRQGADKAASRLDFARLAAGVAEDRYSAGSRAAALTMIVLLRFGVEAAANFVKDLEHHEG